MEPTTVIQKLLKDLFWLCPTVLCFLLFVNGKISWPQANPGSSRSIVGNRETGAHAMPMVSRCAI
jgi:hypothetical protein